MTVDGIFYLFTLVSDLARSKRFYGETLGWTLSTDEPQVAGFAFGNAYLVIDSDDRSPGERRYAGGMHVAVKVADARAEHARLGVAGIAVTDPQDRPWGERSFTFTDPDSYLWTYGQPLR
jgi:catechol 2,3-dioxygenase-like lactoylglutathione lyase family enzyme